MLCGILQADFMYGHGRMDDDRAGYGVDDLVQAIEIAEGWIGEGLTVEPLEKYNLDEFRAWCLSKLKTEFPGHALLDGDKT